MVQWNTKSGEKQRSEIPPGANIQLPQFSQDGKYAAFAVQNYHRHLYDIQIIADENPKPIEIIKSDNPIYSPSFSPGGNKIVYKTLRKSTGVPKFHNFAFAIYDRKTQTQKRITDYAFDFTGAPYFYDPEHIVVAARYNNSKELKRKLWKISITTGKYEELFDIEEEDAYSPTVMPNRTILVQKTNLESHDGIYIYEFYTFDGKDFKQLTDHKTFIEHFALSADGSTLAYRIRERTSGDYKIYLRDLVSGHIQKFNNF
ncbi:hypothetical protein RYZ26_10915 [Terasakiella sp. A23]|uniref:hypothetical protein n=1 Tax=Terasakiella sp. FCG-A23 TaxID=3080561 RepID=UPI002953E4AC|nr:hypothetical protein [Terasakiella sp. A23]MDV7340106.1 hypothetical protein [Terasakiella sp. A23]